jgi:hypothetical protein
VFWLGTKPLVSAGFFLPSGDGDRRVWLILLTKALEQEEEFATDMEKYQIWKSAIGKRSNSI